MAGAARTVGVLVAVLAMGACGSAAAQNSQHANATLPGYQTVSPSESAAVTPGVEPSGGTNHVSFFGPDFNPRAAFCTFSHQVTSVAEGILTVTYPAGSGAPSSGAPYGGAQICEPFTSGPRTTATLTYRVRIPPRFDFVKGGKLPGLYGGVEPFSGERHNANGWSLRLMWRTNGAGEIYAYIAGKTGYGLSIQRGAFTWPADGNWHTVSEHALLNSPGQADGVAALSLDGAVVINATGLDITDTATPISGLFFSTFYGGRDKSWAPSTTTHIDFTNFSAS